MTCTMGMGYVYDNHKESERGVRKRRIDMRTGCVGGTTTGYVCSAIFLLMKRA